MGTGPSWAQNVIRLTRSDPPGQAGSDKARRGNYAAALQQFDELLAAAAAAGHASRPLPLFYALSQAGRAIAAAYGQGGIIDGHGLTEDRTVMGADPLLRKVKRSPRKNDAVTAVCQALNCPDPFGSVGSPMELGAAWAALPELNVFLPGWKSRWLPALRVLNKGAGPEHGLDVEIDLRVTTTAPRQRSAVNHGSYPTLPAGSEFKREPAAKREIPMSSELRIGTVSWPASVSSQTAFDVSYSASNTLDRWLLPAASGSNQAFTPLTAWWVLLFGLSIFARYDPALWVSTLNLDRSRRALPLQLLLDRALDVMPEVVADTLLSGSATGGQAALRSDGGARCGDAPPQRSKSGGTVCEHREPVPIR